MTSASSIDGRQPVGRQALLSAIDNVIALNNLALFTLAAREFVWHTDVDLQDQPELAERVTRREMLDNELNWGCEVEGLHLLLKDIERRLHAVRSAASRVTSPIPRRRRPGAP